MSEWSDRADGLRPQDVALPALAGALLRLYELRAQILVDDEWHAVHELLWGTYGTIATRLSEGSIPLTLLYRALADTIGLSELLMRAPLLLAGLVTLVALPWIAAPAVGRRVAVLFAWLLALAPLHVFYSRYARPYAIVLLLTFAGALWLYRWWRAGSAGVPRAYVACAVLGPWFHPECLPALLTPLLLAAGDATLRRGRGGPHARTLLAIGAIVAGGLALLLGPALLSQGTLVEKLWQTQPSLRTLGMASMLLCGSRHGWVVLTVVILGVVGLVSLWHAQRPLAGYLLAISAAQVGAVVTLAPHGLHSGIVLVRYCIVVLPTLLLLVACGLDACDRRGYAATGRRLPVSPLVLVLMLAASPLPALYAWPNDFTNHGAFQHRYDRGSLERFRPTVIPSFYRRLGERAPGSVSIVEAPWHYHWHSYAYYQRIHRQRVRIGFVGSETGRPGEIPPGAPGFAFRNAVHLHDYDRLSALDVDYVVLHKRVEAELPIPFPTAAVDMAPWLAAYRARYGQPIVEDGTLAVFDVASVP